MEYIATYHDGMVQGVPYNTARRTLEKYITREGVVTNYTPEVKYGFEICAQADTLPSISMYVTIETMKQLIADNLITYISSYEGNMEKRIAEMDAHPEYPQDGETYWWVGKWEPVTSWEEISAWVATYRAQIGEDNWKNNPRMLPNVVGYAGGYEVLAHGVELKPYVYAGTCGTYVTDETAERMIIELGCGKMYSVMVDQDGNELPYADEDWKSLQERRKAFLAEHGGE